MNRRLLLCVAAGLLAGARVRAQSAPTAPALKAAFLVNFARFAEWPPEAMGGGEIAVCFVGRDPTVLAATAIQGKSVGSRTLAVRRAAGPEEFGGCHLLFIAASEERRLPALLQAVENAPVLAVSDAPGFIDAGGTIGLVDSGERFEFEVNLAVAQRNGIRLSSQMLRLARRVLGRPR